MKSGISSRFSSNLIMQKTDESIFPYATSCLFFERYLERRKDLPEILNKF